MKSLHGSLDDGHAKYVENLTLSALKLHLPWALHLGDQVLVLCEEGHAPRHTIMVTPDDGVAMVIRSHRASAVHLMLPHDAMEMGKSLQQAAFTTGKIDPMAEMRTPGKAHPKPPAQDDIVGLLRFRAGMLECPATDSYIMLRAAQMLEEKS